MLEKLPRLVHDENCVHCSDPRIALYRVGGMPICSFCWLNLGVVGRSIGRIPIIGKWWLTQ